MARHAAAQDWAKDQAGLAGENPFAEHAPAAQSAIEKAKAIDGREDEPPSAEAMAGVADVALELARKRHRAAGVERIARVRVMSPTPVLMWRTMPDEEAARFGAAFVASLAERRPFHFLDISGAHVVPSASGDPALGHDPDEGLTIDSESFVLLLAEHLKVEHVLTKNCSIHLT